MFYGTLVKVGLLKGYKDRPVWISYFSRKNYDHGGSCIYIYIYTHTHTHF